MNKPNTSAIFIIDDDQKTVEMIKTNLTFKGFANLHGFTCPIEAVFALEKTQPDLIITSTNMPDAKCSFIAELSQRKVPDQSRSVPVIVLTANPNRENAEAVINAGAASVLLKPIDPEKMVNCVNVALERFRRTDQGQQHDPASATRMKEEEAALLLGQEINMREVFGRPSASS